MTLLLEGRPVARAILAQARDDIAEFATQNGSTPSLAVVSAGDDPSAFAYARAIERTARSIDVRVVRVLLPDSVMPAEFDDAIEQLNRDDGIAGIIVLQPLPSQLDKTRPSEIVAPSKDIDGTTLVNIGRLSAGSALLVPSTPAGGMEILKYYGIPVEGKNVVVVGRSLVVGKPLAMMLISENATVTICHSRTPNLGEFTSRADIVALATGKPRILTAGMIRESTVVLDFGVTMDGDTMRGDADPGVFEVAGAITPVPGGTGVVTNAILMRNFVAAMRESIC
ncbi:MAG TPA: bifunctional 5,10-methylenetetrahydrofolate dehydrogenase/5,10-methenyltetrahydrofolate cyclohydrolase [Nitrolancea sp.]|nr:bifunctional 5,10-methylenetetrahydrofolate dehydrogenase/5,10-methenyltetrahydrofolate cyclohydrolase [Nitrolancea sp.]